MAPKRKRVSESDTNDQVITSSSQLIYETVKGSHEFTIEGYSLAKGTGVDEFKTSGKFTVGGHDWVIRFYPDGDDDHGYISLFLELVSTGEVRALVGFKVVDQSGKEKHGSQFQFINTFKFGTADSDR
ncbi:hypothetical protein MKW94_009585, partial [Papaver nudicaule]|nr:hypothetical protein [Papaver nudicaule]